MKGWDGYSELQVNVLSSWAEMSEDHSLSGRTYSNETMCFSGSSFMPLNWKPKMGNRQWRLSSESTVSIHSSHLRHLLPLESIKIQATPVDNLEVKEMVSLLKLSCNASTNSNTPLVIGFSYAYNKLPFFLPFWIRVHILSRQESHPLFCPCAAL